MSEIVAFLQTTNPAMATELTMERLVFMKQIAALEEALQEHVVLDWKGKHKTTLTKLFEFGKAAEAVRERWNTDSASLSEPLKAMWALLAPEGQEST